MKNRHHLVAIIGCVAALTAACAKPAPVVAPVPTLNADSVAAATRAREAAAVQLRAAAEAKAREAAAEALRLKAEGDARAAAAAAARAESAARADFSSAIYFDLDRSDLSTESRLLLDAKLPLLSANSHIRIRIAGHADDRGSDEYNVALSQKRAASAKRYLVDLGISAERIDVVSFGEERPAAMQSGEDNWSKNRRDEFEIIVGGDSIRVP